MSVVVAIKDNGKVWMACDSQSTRGGTKRTLSNPNNYKISRMKNDKEMLIGGVGRSKFSNVIKIQDEFMDELTRLKGDFNFNYVVKSVVPKLFNLAKEYSLLEKATDSEDKFLANDFLIAYKDLLFSVDSDGTVFEVDDFDAIGSGFELAKGYISQSEIEDKKEVIIKAVRASISSDNYVNYPIIVMNTKDEEVIIIEK
jgi:ATP-dependent protease HslVU (ClpYQ) peptidase subunit